MSRAKFIADVTKFAMAASTITVCGFYGAKDHEKRRKEQMEAAKTRTNQVGQIVDSGKRTITFKGI